MSDAMTRALTRREALVLLGLGALAACFSDRPTETETSGDVDVDMTDQLVFSPATVTIGVGDTVRWRNTSSFPHTATCDPSLANDPASVRLPAGATAWNSGAVAAGGQFSRRFDVAGEYRYFCIPHESQGMVGTIIVTS